MITQEAIRLFKNFLQSNHRQRTIDGYVYLLCRFEMIYAQRALDSTGSDEIYTFLEDLTKDRSKSTRRLRYSQLKTFDAFVKSRHSRVGGNPGSVYMYENTGFPFSRE